MMMITLHAPMMIATARLYDTIHPHYLDHYRLHYDEHYIRPALGTIPQYTRDHTDCHCDERDTGALRAILYTYSPIATRINTLSELYYLRYYSYSGLDHTPLKKHTPFTIPER